MKSENPLSTYCDSGDNNHVLVDLDWLTSRFLWAARGSIYDAIPVPTRESWTDWHLTSSQTASLLERGVFAKELRMNAARGDHQYA